MPRGPRLDIEDTVYHVIARGVERRAIFRVQRDYTTFLDRLAELVHQEDIHLYAYVLMSNHFFVLRRGASRLGRFMHRLLTGHVGAFNRRHERSGHLFQNRYKAVICDADEYLLELVRYVHLNPVRAHVVADAKSYPWSSHRAYLSRHAPRWLDTGTVLAMLGGPGSYERFIETGSGQESPPHLSGRHVGEEDGRRVWLGGQIPGSEEFAQHVVRQARRSESALTASDLGGSAAIDASLAALAAVVARAASVSVEQLRGRGRARQVSAARRRLIGEAMLRRRMRPIDVSRFLGLSSSSVSAHLRALEATEVS